MDSAVYFRVDNAFDGVLNKEERCHEPLGLARSAAGESGNLQRLRG